MASAIHSALNNPLEQLAETRRVVTVDDNHYPVEQVLFKTKEYSVFELSEKVWLAGRKLKRLAITHDHQVFSINVLAGPRDFLADYLGEGCVEWV
ncbi:hypothetical protein [Oceanospirillum sediminis]|uniref:Uncharacterized protein n=1 Tax=Oceanospirillum sediminis TaxID=2760088 RepID=A0A839IN56_9GAMM|nr:hypothetical protein [Oceanospirillum sediminis]MBB1486331.1 hypothetical protein [Oceanospirillum sediminis]